MVLLQCLSSRHGKRTVVAEACFPSSFYEKTGTLQQESSQAWFYRQMDATFDYINRVRKGKRIDAK